MPTPSAGRLSQRARRRAEVPALRREARRRGATTRTRAYSPGHQPRIWPQPCCGAAACGAPPRMSASASVVARAAPHSPVRSRAAIDVPWSPAREVKLGDRSRRQQSWPPCHGAAEAAVDAPVIGDGGVQRGRERLRLPAPPAVLPTAPPRPLQQLSSPPTRPAAATPYYYGVGRGAWPRQGLDAPTARRFAARCRAQHATRFCSRGGDGAGVVPGAARVLRRLSKFEGGGADFPQKRRTRGDDERPVPVPPCRLHLLAQSADVRLSLGVADGGALAHGDAW